MGGGKFREKMTLVKEMTRRCCSDISLSMHLPQIQESAVHMLAKYFPWTAEEASSETTSTTAGGGDLAVHLLHHGLELCDSPRAYENHSGSLLVRLVYEK